MKKLIDFKELHEDVQHYADRNCGENFSYAVRQLVAKALLYDLQEKGGIDQILPLLNGKVK